MFSLRHFTHPTIQSLPKNVFRNTLTTFVFINKGITIHSQYSDGVQEENVEVQEAIILIFYLFFCLELKN